MLLEKMDSDLENPEISESELREKLYRAHKEMFESCDVLRSSSKLLNFCVDDMLSLSQIDSGKFRKNCHNIDIRDTIHEVMSI